MILKNDCEFTDTGPACPCSVFGTIRILSMENLSSMFCIQVPKSCSLFFESREKQSFESSLWNIGS